VGRDNSVEKKFRRELKRLVAVMGLAENFLWLDWLDDTRPFHAAIDVFVSPSRSESFGLAMLEAMAGGTPVVATETDGAKQLFGSKGEFVRIEDPVALARAVSSLLQDGQRREGIAAFGVERAQSMFDVERMIDQTEQMYESVLKEKR